jgi:lipopolysaccharide transport system ATP-binding protein
MNSNLSIHVRGLGKRYPMFSEHAHTEHLRTMIVDGLKSIVSRRHRARRLEDFWALRDVSFDIRRGENVGIIGMNGAGKSTLLKMLSRIVEPTTGSAAIHGRVGALLEVGTGFSWELSGRDNVFLYGSILGMRRAEIAKKFDDIVAFAGVEKHIDVPVKQYSSGMYVKLAFAVAAHLDPEILFLDEVLAVGDLAFQRKCIDHAKKLQERDSTILFVSHNMFSIKTMCDRVIYLRSGQVVYDGSVEGGIELYEKDCRLETIDWGGAGKPESWPIMVNSCELLDECGQSKTVFDHGKPMTLRVSYQVRKPLLNPNFIVTFERSDGVTAQMFSSEADHVESGVVGQDFTLTLRIPRLSLTAEMFTIGLTVRVPNFQDIVCRQIGGTFHVRDPLLSHHFGVFNQPGQWGIATRPVVAGTRKAPEPAEALP